MTNIRSYFNDPVINRQIILSLFLAIQGFKHTYWGYENFTPLEFNLFWAIVEGTICLLIYLLAIEGINPQNLFVFFLGTTLFNILLTGWAFDSFEVPQGFRESSYTQKSKYNSAKPSGTNIAGSFKVHVLPPTIAKLNPNKTHYCLSEDNPTIEIPLQIKGNPPWFIDYERIDFDGNIHSYVNIPVGPKVSEEEKLLHSPKTRKILYHQLKVHEIGFYRIKQIREDTDGMDNSGTVIPSWSKVVNCSSMKWKFSSGYSQPNTFNGCVGSSVTQILKVKGTPPFKVWYLKKVGAEEDIKQVDIEAPSEMKSVDLGKFKEKELPDDLLTLLLKSQPVEIEHEVQVDLQQATTYLLRLFQVQDGYNNVVTYAKDMESHLSKFTAPINGADVRVSRKGSSANLTVRMEGEVPFFVDYVRYNNMEDFKNDVSGEPGNFTEMQSNIEVKQSGIYALKKISDKFCTTSLPPTSFCSVVKTLPPSINISYVPIEASCVGAIGMAVNISLHGEAPFWIDYEQKSGKTVLKKKEHIKKSRHTLELKPSNPGKYWYTITAVGDKNFPEGVEVFDKSFTQTIHPQSNASFITNKLTNSHRCVGDNFTLDVKLTGSKPWTLKYDIMFENSKPMFTVENIHTDTISITTPIFLKGGTYVVALSEITDGNGCSWALDSPDYAIEVAPRRPTVSFKDNRPVLALEGKKTQIPLELVGKPEFLLKYQDPFGRIIEKRFKKQGTSFIEVDKPGTYMLSSVNDAYCSGNIMLTHNQIEVKKIPKPVIRLSKVEDKYSSDFVLYKRNPICEGTPTSVQLEFEGKPPFKYLIKKNFFDKTEELLETVGGQKSVLNLPSEKAGHLSYEINKISDDNYRQFIEIEKKILIHQEILKTPNARILGGPLIAFKCVGELPLDQQLPSHQEKKIKENFIEFEFEGNPPFNLDIEIKNENGNSLKNVTLEPIKEKNFKFTPNIMQSGTYTLLLKSLTDKTGCKRNFEKYILREQSGFHFGATLVKFTVSDVARIRSIYAPSDVCRQDILTYSLEGSSPFKVFYTFENELKSFPVSENVFSVAAENRTGVFHIKQVCNKLNCCTKIEDFVTTVWDWPTATIGEGKDEEIDIREGDETDIHVKLGGTKPFSFTYTIKKFNGNSDESVDVTGIDDYEYIIRTSQEGLYNVTAVYDFHCSYPRKKHQSLDGVNEKIDRLVEKPKKND
ncbi:hypothetical protein HDU92_003199 [Lobulomyces angularis]|nr:hypothetical protein HDU92_003199 [Lobulomyces angularis]